MANTKTGGGGHLENYDPNTGKYVAEDVNPTTKLKTYHSGVGYSKNDITTKLENGGFGKDFTDAYNSADEATKLAMIEYIQSFFSEQNTQAEAQKRYTPLTKAEYSDFRRQAFGSGKLTDEDIDIVGRYIGTGSTSFYLNTAMRYGYDEMLKQHIKIEGYDPNTRPGDWLSRPEVERFIQTMDKATHSYQAPRDMQVVRYTGTGPLVSWLKDTGILDGYQTENNGWHDRLVKGTYNLDELGAKLKASLVGAILPSDGSVMSFSMVPDQSHMIKHTGNKQKDIMFKIDVDQGQPILPTSNSYESEGMFPRDVNFFVKDVRVEPDIRGVKRIVIYYGITK